MKIPNLKDLNYQVAQTPSDIVYQEDKVSLYHYKPTVSNEQLHKTPVLIIYALINRYIMLDLEPDRSFIQNLLDQGLDVYLLDWGYPTSADRYLGLDDYVNGYMNNAVDIICERHHCVAINLVGICMGGSLAVMYAAIHQDKIKNLATFATPIDADIDDAILFTWAKALDVDKINDVFGNLPGDMANILYLLAIPVGTVDRYVQFFNKTENIEFVNTFMRLEKWSYDSPDMAGEAFKDFIGGVIQKNLLIKNQLEIGEHVVNLKNITCPLFNVYGTYDHLVPPASAKALSDAVGSKDVTTHEYKTGHIGMFVGKWSKNTVCPQVAQWIKER
jgi:polyhydroxyalkanoate synthase